MATPHSFTATEDDLEYREQSRSTRCSPEEATIPDRSFRTSWWILPIVISGAGLWALVIKVIIF